MTNRVEEVQEKSVNFVNRVVDMGHKTFLAGLGSVALVQDELKKGWNYGNEFAGKLIERGEKVSQDRREKMNAQAEKRQEQVKDMGKGVSNRIGETYVQASEVVLGAANVPTRTDIEDLSKQIISLSRKVDKVRKEQKTAE